MHPLDLPASARRHTGPARWRSVKQAVEALPSTRGNPIPLHDAVQRGADGRLVNGAFRRQTGERPEPAHQRSISDAGRARQGQHEVSGAPDDLR